MVLTLTDNLGGVKMITESINVSVSNIAQKSKHKKEVSISDRLYPNPANDKITIESELPIGKVVVIDISGKTMYIQNFKNHTTTIDVSNLSKGMYYVRITSDQGEIKIHKIVKN